MNQIDIVADVDKNLKPEEFLIEEKLKRDRKSALYSTLLLIAVFVAVCFVIYEVFIDSGRFLGIRFAERQGKIQPDIKIAAQSETFPYDENIHFVVTKALMRNKEVSINIVVKYEGGDAFVFEPQHFIMHVTNLDNGTEEFYSPLEETPFPFMEKQSRKLDLTYQAGENSGDYALIIYDDSSRIAGKIALNIENS